jgi:maleylpyruvate isomerase
MLPPANFPPQGPCSNWLFPAANRWKRHMKLHGFFRSSAAYRLRIAFALKGVTIDEQEFYALRTGAQRSPEFLKINPQGLVPAIETDDGHVLTQSLAIMEWLEETHPEPAFLPKDPIERAKVRAFALAIACEIHPVQNLKVLNAVKALGNSEEEANEWARRVNFEGLEACEALLAGTKGPFCFGDKPGLADICLIPQLGNARRFGADLSGFKRILEVDAACKELPAFANAVPEKQPDAV